MKINKDYTIGGLIVAASAAIITIAIKKAKHNKKDATINTEKIKSTLNKVDEKFNSSDNIKNSNTDSVKDSEENNESNDKDKKSDDKDDSDNEDDESCKEPFVGDTYDDKNIDGFGNNIRIKRQLDDCKKYLAMNDDELNKLDMDGRSYEEIDDECPPRQMSLAEKKSYFKEQYNELVYTSYTSSGFSYIKRCKAKDVPRILQDMFNFIVFRVEPGTLNEYYQRKGYHCYAANGKPFPYKLDNRSNASYIYYRPDGTTACVASSNGRRLIITSTFDVPFTNDLDGYLKDNFQKMNLNNKWKLINNHISEYTITDANETRHDNIISYSLIRLNDKTTRVYMSVELL